MTENSHTSSASSSSIASSALDSTSSSESTDDTCPDLPIELFLPSPILKHLTCSICNGIFSTPCILACKDIAYTFCEECLVNYIEKHGCCPKCKRETHDRSNGTKISVINDDYPYNASLYEIICCMDVKCRFAPVGCIWTGKFDELCGSHNNLCNSHFLNCKYNPMNCRFKKCEGAEQIPIVRA